MFILNRGNYLKFNFPLKSKAAVGLCHCQFVCASKSIDMCFIYFSEKIPEFGCAEQTIQTT